jgi:hypothetical protein
VETGLVVQNEIVLWYLVKASREVTSTNLDEHSLAALQEDILLALKT